MALIGYGDYCSCEWITVAKALRRRAEAANVATADPRPSMLIALDTEVWGGMLPA